LWREKQGTLKRLRVCSAMRPSPMRTTVRSADKGAATAAGLVETVVVAEAAARGPREREPAAREGRRRSLDGGEGDGMAAGYGRAGAANIADIFLLLLPWRSASASDVSIPFPCGGCSGEEEEEEETTCGRGRRRSE
jgi:hypothetical protein